MDMNATEFGEVIDAFEAVRDLFRCAQCMGLLNVVAEGASPVTVKCPCGATAWNLERR